MSGHDNKTNGVSTVRHDNEVRGGALDEIEDVSDEVDEPDEVEGNSLLEEPEDPGPIEPAPAQVLDLAAACVRYVASRYGVMLDFEPDTLSLIDQYVRDAKADVASKPETLDVVQASVGAYFGEVIRRVYGGFWFADGDFDGWRVDMSRVYMTFNPLGMIREAVLSEAQDGWHAHLEMDPAEREVVESRLEAMPEVDEDEYYAPTTRFDVVALAHDALRMHMRENGTADVRFTQSDYSR